MVQSTDARISAAHTHCDSAWTRVRTRVRTDVWPASGAVRTSVSRGRTAPTIVGPGHTDKRIRFCDTILCKVLRYSFAESLSRTRGHTAIVHRRSILERKRIHCSFSSFTRPHGVAGKLKINEKHGVEIVTNTGM